MSSTEKPVIVVIDDQPDYGEILAEFLISLGYEVRPFLSASAFLEARSEIKRFDLVISDINMPGATGYDVCRALRTDDTLGRVPIILITGSDPTSERSKGYDAGADDFIGKPFSPRDLHAKIRSLLEIRAKEIVTHGTLKQMRQFLPPNVADIMASRPQLLKPHREQVTVLFADLRRFTSFSERVEPEEVLQVLEQYYTIVGNAAIKYRGTLGHLAGDGIMVFFNDPEPQQNHMELAIRMALEAREGLIEQRKVWEQKNYNIDFGIGISEGHATIGGIGFDHFSQYTVIGTVTNFAARLCGVADKGQILVSKRFLGRLQDVQCEAKSLGQANLKGFEGPVSVNDIVSIA